MYTYDPIEFHRQLASQPLVIQLLAAEFPPDVYKIKNGAPYKLTCSGSKVELCSYYESGEVGVILRNQDKQALTIKHEIQQLGFGTGGDTIAIINSKWLEPTR